MKTATLDLNALHAANKCASDESTRYYLCGVCVEFHDSEIIYVATDGHILFAYRQVSSEHTLRGTYIIPSEAIKATKLNKKLPIADLVVSDDGKFSLTVPSQSGVLFSPIDGAFPDWRRVIPTDILSPAMAAYDPTLLTRLWTAGKIINSEKPTLTQGGYGPAYVSFSDANAFGVIMPIRTDKPAICPPAWLNVKGCSVSNINEAA